jgi:hypothetical protein
LAGSHRARRRLTGAQARRPLAGAAGAASTPRGPRSSLDCPGPAGGAWKTRGAESLKTRPYGRSCRRMAGLRRVSATRNPSRGRSGEPKRTPGRCGTIELRVAFGPLVWIGVTPKPTGEHSINDREPFCGHPLQRN